MTNSKEYLLLLGLLSHSSPPCRSFSFSWR